MDFAGKTAWITGASSGIGAALAAALAREGARPVLSGRDLPRLEKTAEACRRAGASAVFILPFDLEDRDAVAAAPARAAALAGPVDLLVNNAGLGQRGLALATGPEILERVMAVDFFAAASLARGVAPGMVARGGGRLAVVTSLLAKFGAPRRSAYAAAKHALHGWFESLRAELLGTGVGVTLLVPGWVRTDISRRALEADGAAHGALDPGQARGLAPEECARRMVRALARDADEQLIGGRECLAAYGKRFFPKWLARRVARGGIG